MSYISISAVVGDEIHSMQTVPFPLQQKTGHKGGTLSMNRPLRLGEQIMPNDLCKTPYAQLCKRSSTRLEKSRRKSYSDAQKEWRKICYVLS